MKRLFVFLSLVLCVAGVVFYLPLRDSAPSKIAPLSNQDKRDILENQTTPSQEKECACCQSTLEKIKRKRQALEMWARERINMYGYEEGMKRISEKSATLAKRMQTLLEKEKDANGFPAP